VRYVSTMITGVLLPDGWHTVVGQMAIEFDPVIADAVTQAEATPRGGAWARWLEPSGVFTLAPLDRIIAIRHTPVSYVKTGGAMCRAGGSGVRA
jgi:hypothetical protein